MSKRSPDPVPLTPSTPLKHPRMEGPFTRTQTPSPAQTISDERLKHYHWFLCDALDKKEDPSQIFQDVYGICYSVWAKSGRTPVEKAQFLERVQKNPDTQNRFFETLEKAINTPLDRKNLEDLFFHGMCFCYRTIRSRILPRGAPDCSVSSIRVSV